MMNFSQFKTQYHLTLDSQQEAAVQAVDGPVMLLAVPGSGKTTVLVTRLGYMCLAREIPPQQILTMTYTVSAARDMRQRFADLFGEDPGNALEFRTINGVCSRIIRLYERTMDRTAFQLLDNERERNLLLADLCRSSSGEYATESTISAVSTAITYAKNQMLTDKELDTVDVEGIQFPEVYRAYCQTLRAQKRMDYDDQMVYALQILRQYPQILQIMQERYRYFCVDEAQDTSKIQHCIIQLLAGKSQNLFMVGDEDQSIYGFRAAYPQALTQFESVYPSAQVLYMEQNYRSAAPIVAAADRVIQNNKNRHPKHMRATQGAGPDVQELPVWNRLSQYREICKMAEHCTEETAVLYRDNDSALPLIDLLDRSGIPYRCRQVTSGFFTHRCVQDFTDIIRFAEHPSDGARFMNIYYKLGAGISRNVAREAITAVNRDGGNLLTYIADRPATSDWTRRQCKNLQSNFTALLREPADQAIYRIVHFMGYGNYLDDRGMDDHRIAILEALGANQPSPVRLLERLTVLQQIVEQGGSGEAPFVLSTIHSSKGLEYPRVILADVIDGILPNAVPANRASQEELDDFEEERRLFYVGMTRAKRELLVFTFQKPELHSVFTEELFQKTSNSTSQPLKTKKQGHKLLESIGRRPSGPDKKQIAEKVQECVVGTQIVHKTFGAGKITSKNGDIVHIAFDSGTCKKFSLSTALRSGQLRLEQ